MSYNTTERSNILLLCLGLDVDRSSIAQVTTRILYCIFRPFGPLNKIVLFSKNPIVKAFLEYKDLDSSQLAVETAHESLIDNFGKARLYYSTLTELKFSNRFLDFLDCSREDFYDIIKPVTLPISRPKDSEPLGTPNKPRLSADFETHHATPNVGSFGFSNSLLTPIQRSAMFFSADRAVGGLPPSDALSIHTNRSTRSNNELEPSKVVLFSNIDDSLVTALEIFNLFSCFGNLRKVLFMKNIRKAMLEFTNIEYAQNCLLYMNNRPFGSSKIKVNFSKYKKIDLKKNNKSENSQNFNEVIIVLPEMDRYSPANLSIVTPPSPYVLISCAKRPGIELVDINLLVQSFIKPVNSRLLDESGEPSLGTDNFRVLFQFASIADAMLIVAKVHNSSLNGAVIEASFETKSA